MIPDKYISATASIIPDPQIPVIPIDTVFSLKSGSSDHKSEPITLKRASRVDRLILTLSIAPGAARCPEVI